MISSLISGIVIGILLAIPPGPVGVTAIKYGLFKSDKAGRQLALGNALMDTIFCILAVFATSFAVSKLSEVSHHYPLLTLILQIGIIVGFLVFGFLNLKDGKQSNVDYYNNEQPFKMPFMQNLRNRGVFFLGIAIALTNIANPTFITSLTWISVQVQNFHFVEDNFIARIFYAFGFGLGNFIWIYSLVKLVIRFKHRMSDDFLLKIKRFAGYTFIGFGTILGWRVVQFTKWPEILQILFAF